MLTTLEGESERSVLAIYRCDNVQIEIDLALRPECTVTQASKPQGAKG